MVYTVPGFMTLVGPNTVMTFGLPIGIPLTAPIGTFAHATPFLRLLAPYGTSVSPTPYVFAQVGTRLVGLALCFAIENT